jgi:hypothetical protein
VGGVTGAGNATIGALGWLKDRIVGIFAGAGSWLWDAGRAIVDGLIRGMESKAKRLGEVVSGIAGSVTRGFRSALGIRSPSTVARQQGIFFMEGFRLGIQDMHGQS